MLQNIRHGTVLEKRFVPDMQKKLEQNLTAAAYSEYKNIFQQLGSVPITAVENAQQKCVAVYEEQKGERV